MKTPKGKKTSRNMVVALVNIFASMAMLAGLVTVAFFANLHRLYHAPGAAEKDQIILIKKGNNLSQIASSLEQSGAVYDGWLFALATATFSQPNRLQAGEYVIAARSSIADITDILIKGNIRRYSITVPEGWTNAQIVTALNNNPALTGSITSTPPEGGLFPDTYFFVKGSNRQALLNLMQSRARNIQQKIWQQRNPNLPLKSLQEFVTLASIVEKETGVKGERARIAGVFVNRLNKKIRLESDPTILYGLYKGAAWEKPRTITRSQLRKKTAYNTYHIDGLPPGAIANPGRLALEAVAYPMKTEDLFFVADGTGGHAFAKTFKQHLANVKVWRKIEAERKRQNQKN